MSTTRPVSVHSPDRLTNPVSLRKTQRLLVKYLVQQCGAQAQAYFLVLQGDKVLVKAASPSINRKRTSFTSVDLIEQLKQLHQIKEIVPNQENGLLPLVPDVRAQLTVGIPLRVDHKNLGTILLVLPRNGAYLLEDLQPILTNFSEIAVLALKKAELYEKFQQVRAERDLFLSLVTHELRTPITSVSGYVQLLNKTVMDPSSKSAKWIQELSLEMSRLIGTVNDIIEIHRLKSGHDDFAWQVVSLQELLNEALNEILRTFPESRFSFMAEKTTGITELTVVGDPTKLGWVLRILLQDAATHSIQGLTTIRVARMKKNWVIVINSQPEESSGALTESPNTLNEHHLLFYLAQAIVHRHRGRLRFLVNGRERTFQLILPKV